MNDAGQKQKLVRHFSMRGWYAQPEVDVFHRGGVNEEGKLITDIDVFALRPTPDLKWEKVFGDCKTLKGQSPANRVLWLRGLMESFGAARGLIILRKKQPIEFDHKHLASSLEITLLDESEFEQYDKAINFPGGSADFGYGCDVIEKIVNLPNRFKGLRPLCAYIHKSAWCDNDYMTILRRTIGEGRSVSMEIDPSKPEHLALILDASAVFSIGLAECVGIIFNQYLQPNSKKQLEEALRILIWGGKAQYSYISKLRNELSVVRGQQTPDNSFLGLPEWDRFVHLVRSILDAPRLAFLIPTMLRRGAFDVIEGKSFLDVSKKDSLLLIKFCMLTSIYYCKACKFPIEAEKDIEQKFIKLQGNMLRQVNSQNFGNDTFRTLDSFGKNLSTEEDNDNSKAETLSLDFNGHDN